MTRWVSGPILLVLAAGVGLGVGTALDPSVKAENGKLEPYSDHTYWRKFDAGRKAEVVAVGEGTSFLALYVFDGHGNCVVYDDDVSSRSPDDAAVQWVPAQTGLYTIEVRSLNNQKNQYVMRVRQDSIGTTSGKQP